MNEFIDSYEYLRPRREDRAFAPWHKPRKQFVREKQWVEQIDRLFSEGLVADGDPIAYLCLPGDDFLDIRHIHERICVPRASPLIFLGFRSGGGEVGGDSTGQYVSLDEVKRLDHVDAGSELLLDDFATIGVRDSMASRKVGDVGPFAAINLDLCSGFFRDFDGGQGATFYNALQRIIAVQSARRVPWVLFVTTRVSPESVGPNLLAEHLVVIGRNMDDCPEFARQLPRIVRIDGLRDKTKDDLSPEEIMRLSLIGFCKEVAGFLGGLNPPARAELRSVQGYKVDGGAPCQDMASLAIRVTPTDEPVHSRRAGFGEFDRNHNECAIARRVLDRVERMVDVDHCLQRDNELSEQMRDQTRRLLIGARYSPDAVDRFLSE